jgi:hypothetical protein
VIRWTDRPSLKAELAQAETAQEALREQETLRQDMQCELFLKGELTPAANANLGWLGDLNPHLRRRKFVATVCLLHPNELPYRLRLPPLFEILPFEARDGVTGSIAFARAALLLSVALQERRLEAGGGAMIA